MTKEMFVINLPEGLHMRPAGVLARVIQKFDSDVTLIVGGKNINAKSVIGIVAACVKCGTEVWIECNGVDELEAIAEIKKSMEAGLGEGEKSRR